MTSHSSHTLTFSQLVGTFTVDKELIGAQDPYVIFEAGGKKTQTKAIKGVGAGTCEWKETYELKDFSPKSAIKEATSKTANGSILEVTVYNHNTLRPDGAIGSGTVDLARLGSSQLSGSGDRVTVHLTDKKGKSTGELKFLIHGGGYQGAGSSSTGYGTTAGGATAGGVSHGSGTHGSGIRGSEHESGRPITGVGEGTTYSEAHYAAQKAAREQHDVSINTREGVAHGHPTGAGVTGAGATQGVHGHGHTHTHGSEHNSGTVASGVRGVDVTPGAVIDRKYYTGTEDRPQEQALVEQYREHNPYEKQYETTVQHTGRERHIGSSIEALGTQEKVVDTKHHVHTNPHDLIARALPEGAVSQRPGGEGWVQGKAGPICDTTSFAVTGDITVDKERVTNLREHREFEKEFEVKTALVGERALDEAAQVEQLKRERILLDEKHKNACEGHPDVHAPQTGHGVTGSHTTTGHGLTGSHGTTGHSTTGGQGITGAVRDATTGHSHGTTGYGQGTTGTTGHTTDGQDKSLFQKAKEAVTGTSTTGQTGSHTTTGSRPTTGAQYN
jgi:hypothetical protein